VRLSPVVTCVSTKPTTSSTNGKKMKPQTPALVPNEFRTTSSLALLLTVTPSALEDLRNYATIEAREACALT
jgi:hypothetical protein